MARARSLAPGRQGGKFSAKPDPRRRNGPPSQVWSPDWPGKRGFPRNLTREEPVPARPGGGGFPQNLTQEEGPGRGVWSPTGRGGGFPQNLTREGGFAPNLSREEGTGPVASGGRGFA